MAEYSKPWLSIDEQVETLSSRGVVVSDRARAARLLTVVGYYRFSGYLFPFRRSERYMDDNGHARIRVLDEFREGTTFEDAVQLIEFDRALRLLVLEGVETIEVALRTQIGHVLGKRSTFAQDDPSLFVPGFTEVRRDRVSDEDVPSRWEEWRTRVNSRCESSDEAFVAHFRAKYQGRMPIWALTEVLELGHLSRLYSGLRNDLATEIANAFDVPTKKLLSSWIATINYIRNISAHHARMFNKKLVIAPKRPSMDVIPLVAHVSADDAPKEFGVYNALVVMAYLHRRIEPESNWPGRVAELLQGFPRGTGLDLSSMGLLPHWLEEEIWKP